MVLSTERLGHPDHEVKIGFGTSFGRGGRKRELIRLCNPSSYGLARAVLLVDSIDGPMIRWDPRMGREGIVT